MCILNRVFSRSRNNCNYTVCNCNEENQDNFNQNTVLTISADNIVNTLDTASQTNNICSSCARRNTCNCCNCGNSNNNRVTARINVIPNNNTNGRTGCLCGNYRRR